ncbi:MAG: sugar-binding protein [bacterium]
MIYKIVLIISLFITNTIIAKDLSQSNATIEVLPSRQVHNSSINALIKRPLITVKSVPNAIIDGIFSEKITSLPLEINSKLIRNNKTSSGTIYIGFDENNLYLYADINDKTPGNNVQHHGDIWNGDALELTLCTDSHANPMREAFTSHDFRIIIKASPDTQSWNCTKQSPLIKPIIFYTQKKSGWIIEAFIPWYNFDIRCFCSIKDKTLGFNTVIDNADNLLGRNNQATWTGKEDFIENPSQWGQIIFSTKK